MRIATYSTTIIRLIEVTIQTKLIRELEKAVFEGKNVQSHLKWSLISTGDRSITLIKLKKIMSEVQLVKNIVDKSTYWEEELHSKCIYAMQDLNTTIAIIEREIKTIQNRRVKLLNATIIPSVVTVTVFLSGFFEART